MTGVERARSTRAMRMALFPISALGLCLVVIPGLLWFASPRGENVSLGMLARYPPSDQPYDVTIHETHLFVINTGGSLLVLDASSTRPGCYWDVTWNRERSRFEDPCHGARYLLDGQWEDGPPTRDLDHYRSREQGSELIVNLTQLIRGEESWRSHE